jgi:hypothetical protein
MAENAIDNEKAINPALFGASNWTDPYPLSQVSNCCLEPQTDMHPQRESCGHSTSQHPSSPILAVVNINASPGLTNYEQIVRLPSLLQPQPLFKRL